MPGELPWPLLQAAQEGSRGFSPLVLMGEPLLPQRGASSRVCGAPSVRGSRGYKDRPEDGSHSFPRWAWRCTHAGRQPGVERGCGWKTDQTQRSKPDGKPRCPPAWKSGCRSSGRAPGGCGRRTGAEGQRLSWKQASGRTSHAQAPRPSQAPFRWLPVSPSKVLALPGALSIAAAPHAPCMSSRPVL